MQVFRAVNVAMSYRGKIGIHLRVKGPIMQSDMTHRESRYRYVFILLKKSSSFEVPKHPFSPEV